MLILLLSRLQHTICKVEPMWVSLEPEKEFLCSRRTVDTVTRGQRSNACTNLEDLQRSFEAFETDEMITVNMAKKAREWGTKAWNMSKVIN